MQRLLLSLVLFCSFSAYATADTITIGGTITQSTPDGTGPAVNNPSLNNVIDQQSYTLTLITPTGINAPGTYDLSGSSLSFFVSSASAGESNFGAISLTISADGSFADFSLFACVLGADCFQGNQLSASFQVPLGGITGTNITATGLDQPHPFDLLEDDGITDIQGSVDTFSNTAAGVAVTPEPSSITLMLLPCLAIIAMGYRRGLCS